MRKKLIKTALILLTFAPIVLAQVPTPPTEFWPTVNKIVGLLLAIVFFLGVIFLILGGIMYITAGGDPSKVDRAKDVLVYAVIGVGVAVLAWALMRFLMSYLTGGAPS